MRLPDYDPMGRCPKCNGEDVATRHVKQGGKYGEPCEFYSSDVRDTEHMHRHCRRCSFEWCEACLTKPVERPTPYIYCECPSCHATGWPELFLKQRTWKIVSVLDATSSPLDAIPGR